jgi:AcrR family transcriptional regulator
VRSPEATRQKILEAAAEEIHRQGFQASGLNRIVDRAGITKGALFHHFKDKRTLGLAVVDELLRPGLHQKWLDPLRTESNPVDGVISSIQLAMERIDKEPETMLKGCPVGNLCTEMSGLDEEFRQHLNAIYEEIVAGYATAFQRGIELGLVRPGVDPRSVGSFLLSFLQGAVVMMKTSGSTDITYTLTPAIMDYLQGLRSTA